MCNMLFKLLIIVGLALSLWAAADEPIVSTNYGKIKGFISKTAKDQDFYTFHNIPFAKAPTGKLRLKNPEPPESWEGVRNGIERHKSCPQVSFMAHAMNLPVVFEGNEDCLYLSIYTQKVVGDLLPVMVHIHGGGFMIGSGGQYSGGDIVKENVLVVSINYRLGILGFLSTEDGVIPGNIGLKDQTMALKWVQDNIVHFGGDPKQVTIFGHSAGSASVHFHILSSYSKGLFNRAIMQSGTALAGWAFSRGQRGIALQLGAEVGCFTPSEIGKQQSRRLLKCLQQVDDEALIMSFTKFMNWTIFPLNFGPSIDGDFITAEPEVLMTSENYVPVDVMIGYTTDEGSFLTDMLFGPGNNLEKVQQNFEYYGPISLVLSYENDAEELSRNAYDHYLRKNSVDLEDIEELIQLYSDRHFKVSTDIVAQMHTGNVYLYEFEYKGRYTLGSLMNRGIVTKWVSHGDDLFYLFPLNEIGLNCAELNENDSQMKEIMIKLWTNFAKTGNPTPDKSLNFKWERFDKQSPKLLVLNLTPEIKECHREKVNEFWASLPTRQNQLLYSSQTNDYSMKYEL